MVLLTRPYGPVRATKAPNTASCVPTCAPEHSLGLQPCRLQVALITERILVWFSGGPRQAAALLRGLSSELWWVRGYRILPPLET